VAANLQDQRRIAAHDRANVERLAREVGGDALITVPLLDDDVHDIAGLAEIDRYLFAPVRVEA
jgi:hypothetical protein